MEPRAMPWTDDRMRASALRLLILMVTSVAVLSDAPALATARPVSAPPADLQPFSAEDLMRLKRISDPQVSPDGRHLAYVLRETDFEANNGRTALWLLDLTHPHAAPRRLTTDAGNDSSPRWGP